MLLVLEGVSVQPAGSTVTAATPGSPVAPGASRKRSGLPRMARPSRSLREIPDEPQRRRGRGLGTLDPVQQRSFCMLALRYQRVNLIGSINGLRRNRKHV